MDIDNGMVINGSREWERMYSDTPYDLATEDDMENYAYDRERIHEVVEAVCHLDYGDLAEDVAVMVYDQLRPDRKKKRLRDWFRQRVNREDYNEWKGQ